MFRSIQRTPCRSASRAIAPLLALAAASLLLTAPRAAAAIIPAGQVVSLADLMAGDTIVVGDKVFSNFNYTPNPNGNFPSSSDVSVSGIVVGNAVRLQFSGQFIDLPGGGGSDAGLSFDVNVTDPLRYISGATLAGTLSTTGDDAEVHVDESFIVGAPLLPGEDALLRIERKVVGGVLSPFNQNSDSVDFGVTHGVVGFQQMTVIKNIFADAGSFTFNSARVTTFIQEFEQTEIPEPATMALAGMSGVAMIFVARRRR